MFYFYRSITSIFSFVFKIIIYIRKILGKEDKSRFREKINSNYYNIKKIKIARGLCPTSSLRKAEDELLIMNY